MPNSTRFLTFDSKQDGVVREWQTRAMACNEQTIEALAQQFDAQIQALDRRAEGPVTGFTVRARQKRADGQWAVMEFTYPMDYMFQSQDDPGQLVDGEQFRSIVEHFHEYLSDIAGIQDPVVDLLVYERHERVDEPEHPTDQDVVARVRAAQGNMSVSDVLRFSEATSSEAAPTIGVGGVVGGVISEDKGGSRVALDPGIKMGHLMEMILTPDGEEVHLHPLLDTLGLNFKRHKLTRSVINPHYPTEREDVDAVALPRQKI